MVLPRLIAVVVALALSSGAALAAGSSSSLPPPDPTAANLTNAQIQERAYEACLITQGRLIGTPRETLRQPCNCYARGTIRSMTPTELANFRATGYFDDTTREKALGFIDRCSLKRPI